LLATIGFGEGEDNRQWLLAYVHHKLNSIAEEATTIKKMMLQGIISASVRTLYHSQQGAYNAAEMEDSYKLGNTGYGPLNDIRVVLTTALGVQCTAVHDPGSNQSPKKTRTVLLKSRVLLSSALQMESVKIESAARELIHLVTRGRP
jgi:hypothetical protein